MLVEADRFIEKGAAVVDDGVDSAQLLEDLNGTGDKKAAARVELIGPEDVFPGACVEFGLDADGVDDIGVEFEDVSFRGVVGSEAAEDFEGLVLTFVGGEPARSFGEDPEEDEHGGEEDPLENAGNAPGEGGVVV